MISNASGVLECNIFYMPYSLTLELLASRGDQSERMQSYASLLRAAQNKRA